MIIFLQQLQRDVAFGLIKINESGEIDFVSVLPHFVLIRANISIFNLFTGSYFNYLRREVAKFQFIMIKIPKSADSTFNYTVADLLNAERIQRAFQSLNHQIPPFSWLPGVNKRTGLRISQ